jgi:hypothetical protein
MSWEDVSRKIFFEYDDADIKSIRKTLAPLNFKKAYWVEASYPRVAVLQGKGVVFYLGQEDEGLTLTGQAQSPAGANWLRLNWRKVYNLVKEKHITV